MLPGMKERSGRGCGNWSKDYWQTEPAVLPLGCSFRCVEGIVVFLPFVSCTACYFKRQHITLVPAIGSQGYI